MLTCNGEIVLQCSLHLPENSSLQILFCDCLIHACRVCKEISYTTPHVQQMTVHSTGRLPTRYHDDVSRHRKGPAPSPHQRHKSIAVILRQPYATTHIFIVPTTGRSRCSVNITYAVMAYVAFYTLTTSSSAKFHYLSEQRGAFPHVASIHPLNLIASCFNINASLLPRSDLTKILFTSAHPSQPSLR